MPNCHICYSLNVTPVDMPDFKYVSSDARPVSEVPKFMVCAHCGSVQKIADDAYIVATNNIYLSYKMNYLSDGNDPYVCTWDNRKGPRCDFLAQYVKENLEEYPESVLDIGCGEGNYLQAFGEVMPTAKLRGFDTALQKEQKFQGKFYTGELAHLKECFNVITCFHTLEHVVNPLVFLNEITKKLYTTGTLFIVVPDFEQNPYDLVVYDHCTHFTPATLNRLLARAGYHVLKLDRSFIRKEIIIMAKKIHETDVFKFFERQVKKCELMRVTARESTVLRGASNTAVWLTQEMDKVDYYIDEDPNKQGKMLMGKPVVGEGKVANAA